MNRSRSVDRSLRRHLAEEVVRVEAGQLNNSGHSQSSEDRSGHVEPAEPTFKLVGVEPDLHIRRDDVAVVIPLDGPVLGGVATEKRI